MKNYQDVIDQYEQYLNGELDEDGKRDIEDAIANDKELADILEDHKILLDGIKYSARKNLMTKLKEWDNNFSAVTDQENTESKGRNIKWYYIAASLAVFVIGSVLIYNYNFNSYQRIASRHYVVYDHPTSKTRGEKMENNKANKITEYYNLGQYEKVIEMTNQLNQVDRSEEIDFLLANSFMAVKNYDAAISIYKELSNSKNGYKYGSLWYLSLCYLYEAEVDQAIPLLNEVAKSKSSSSSKAKNLLKDLN